MLQSTFHEHSTVSSSTDSKSKRLALDKTQVKNTFASYGFYSKETFRLVDNIENVKGVIK